MTDQSSYVSLDDFVDSFNIDDVLAKQVYLLSLQDRNDISEEIHGVGSMACEETPDLIEDSLRLLFIELHNLPPQYKSIYQLASTSARIGKAATSTNNINNEGFDHLVENMDTSSEDQFDDDLFSDQEIPPVVSIISSCYVKSQNFLLAFLRCEFFDAKKAAMRLVKYLELVYDLFGEEALRRPLRVDDFRSKEEIEVLDAGNQQLLPFRDRCGRRVLFMHGDMNLPSSSLMARSVLSKGPAMKVLLYLWSVLLEDVEAQRRGLVIVFWPRYIDHRAEENGSKQETDARSVRSRGRKNKGNLKRTIRKPRKFNQGPEDDASRLITLVPDANSTSTGMRFFEAVPVRTCAIHLCLPNLPFLRLIRSFALFILGENFRTRVKSHDGVGLEVIYSLMGYGIPVDILPFDEVTQTVKTKNFASFIKVRRRIETEQSDMYNSNNPSSGAVSDSHSSHESVASDGCMIECPSLNDVIFRSGKSYMSHPGNMMFRELIEHHIDEHNIATQDRKKNLTWQVIEEVEIKGGRFLEYNRNLGTWTELTDRSAIRHKIATYFKEFRRKIKAQKQIQMNQSSTHEFEAQDGRMRKRQKGSPNYVSETCFSYLGIQRGQK